MQTLNNLKTTFYYDRTCPPAQLRDASYIPGQTS